MEIYYHGRPCKRCGSTLKYRRGRGCLSCRNIVNKIPLPRKSTYQGSKCNVCGGVERYESNRACVACVRIKNRLAAERRKEQLNKIPLTPKSDHRCLSCGCTPSYYFLDFCRKCLNKQKRKEWGQNLNRCCSCGEFKNYPFKDFCRKCAAAERKRRKAAEEAEQLRKYESPF